MRDFSDRTAYMEYIRWLQSVRLVSHMLRKVIDPLAFRAIVLMRDKYVDRLRPVAGAGSSGSTIEVESPYSISFTFNMADIN